MKIKIEIEMEADDAEWFIDSVEEFREFVRSHTNKNAPEEVTDDEQD